MSISTYDVIVVGAGHAGCEAAIASARMGCKTLLLTMNLDNIALMSCNPAVGGIAKGHIVREIDALGGEMGKVTDAAGIQFRMLNTSKGPAVQALRVQADRNQYKAVMRSVLEKEDGLNIVQGMVESLLITEGVVRGVKTNLGIEYYAKAVILTTGTFLKGLIHVGLLNYPAGRAGEFASFGLSNDLADIGFTLGRLKTGTPPRLNARTIDFSVMAEQKGDNPITPFSYTTGTIERPQISCFLTHTSTVTHDIIRKNLDRSPLYGGVIKGTGPRYCPSIEDKIMRFSHKERHQVFLEPEGYDNIEIYANGISTSLPVDVQLDIVRSIRGLEDAEIMRPGYAIEYDFVPPTQLKPTLETKLIEGLYNAGQINGTSGYEEAAAQGLIAGINAVLKIHERGPFILDRSEAYIGVLIDDLITKGTLEPYRMFTSRAEFRLLLRHDNADARLTEKGFNLGLITSERYDFFKEKRTMVENEIFRLRKTRVGKVANHLLAKEDENSEDKQKQEKRITTEIPSPLRGEGKGGCELRLFSGEPVMSEALSKENENPSLCSRGGMGESFSNESPTSVLLTKNNEHPPLSKGGLGGVLPDEPVMSRELTKGHENTKILRQAQDDNQRVMVSLSNHDGQYSRNTAFSGEPTPIKTGQILPDTTLAHLLQRPEINYRVIEKISPSDQTISEEIIKSVEIEIKYDGYIKRQLELVGKFKNMENKQIPPDFDYTSISGLSREVVEKLNKIRPVSLGHASRISGVTPAAVTIIAITLAKKAREKKFHVEQKGSEQ